MLMAALLGCGAADREAATTADSAHVLVPPPTAEGDSALYGFIHSGVIQPGATRAELATRLGPPDSVNARTVENRHDPTVTDSVLTVYYPGLTAEIYRAGYDGREIIASLQITADAHLQPASPVRMGATPDAVRSALGAPSSATDSVLEYVCDECLVSGHEIVRFILGQGAVRRIHVQYWVD